MASLQVLDWMRQMSRVLYFFRIGILYAEAAVLADMHPRDIPYKKWSFGESRK